MDIKIVFPEQEDMTWTIPEEAKYYEPTGIVDGLIHRTFLSLGLSCKSGIGLKCDE